MNGKQAISFSQNLRFLLYFTIFNNTVNYNFDFTQPYPTLKPNTVAARSKTWTVFARSNIGIVGSNPTQGMDVCVLFCV
jgi:hypothetical protein